MHIWDAWFAVLFVLFIGFCVFLFLELFHILDASFAHDVSLAALCSLFVLFSFGGVVFVPRVSTCWMPGLAACVCLFLCCSFLVVFLEFFHILDAWSAPGLAWSAPELSLASCCSCSLFGSFFVVSASCFFFIYIYIYSIPIFSVCLSLGVIRLGVGACSFWTTSWIPRGCGFLYRVSRQANLEPRTSGFLDLTAIGLDL